MGDVTETLQQLLERRLRELGARRGRDTLSLREVWQTLPTDSEGKRPISYELVRRVRESGHTNISDRAADAIATMLDVAVSDVLTAAGQRPRLGRFELPRRADRLNDRERDVVVSVVDTILQAADAERPERPVVSRPAVRQSRGSGKSMSVATLRTQLQSRLADARTDQERTQVAELLAELDRAETIAVEEDTARGAS